MTLSALELQIIELLVPMMLSLHWCVMQGLPLAGAAILIRCRTPMPLKETVEKEKTPTLKGPAGELPWLKTPSHSLCPFLLISPDDATWQPFHTNMFPLAERAGVTGWPQFCIATGHIMLDIWTYHFHFHSDWSSNVLSCSKFKVQISFLPVTCISL